MGEGQGEGEYLGKIHFSCKKLKEKIDGHREVLDPPLHPLPSREGKHK
jgi:hypothetical protein